MAAAEAVVVLGSHVDDWPQNAILGLDGGYFLEATLLLDDDGGTNEEAGVSKRRTDKGGPNCLKRSSIGRTSSRASCYRVHYTAASANCLNFLKHAGVF